MALFSSYLVPAGATIVLLVVGFASGGVTLAIAVVFSLFLIAAAQLAFRRARRRTLTVLPNGLEVQRDHYRLMIPWDHITAIRRRRHQLFLSVEELVFHDAEVIALDANDRPTKPPKRLQGHPATTRIAVDLYDARWRQGPIGERVRQLGLALKAWVTSEPPSPGLEHPPDSGLRQVNRSSIRFRPAARPVPRSLLGGPELDSGGRDGLSVKLIAPSPVRPRLRYEP